jgi:hypothetical protein
MRNSASESMNTFMFDY